MENKNQTNTKFLNMNTNTDITPHIPEQLQCGIVMPISAFDGYTAEHWLEVKAIITDAVSSIESPKFHAKLVSDADEVGVIQKRIVQGVYGSSVVVCDVSGKNPNVMFELGMRLAFDKPTIIIKDDKTDYTFDTGVIEHITYPRDLRFQRIIDFKATLSQKLLASYRAAERDPEHSTFLKNFGTFKVAQLSEKETTTEQLILNSIMEMQRDIASLRNRYRASFSFENQSDLAQKGLLSGEIISIEEVENTLAKAESLMAFGSAESWTELHAMTPALQKLRDLPRLPERATVKLDSILSAIAPTTPRPIRRTRAPL